MEDYLHIIRCLYAINTDRPQGYTENELSLAEQKLNCKLPEKLRHYYLLLGRNSKINNTHNRLLAPNEIYYTDSGHLVFYEENQVVAVWGIDGKSLGELDPPIWGSYDSDKEEWFEDSDTTEDFLRSMAYLNAALGGLSYTAWKEKPDSETIALIEENWEEQTNTTNQLLRFFTNDHTDMLMLTLNEQKRVDSLYIAGNSKEAYSRIISKLDIAWEEHTDWK